MPDDRTRLRELRQDAERKAAALAAVQPTTDDESPASPAERRDSAQAQENLDRTLETGEENPIS